MCTVALALGFTNADAAPPLKDFTAKSLSDIKKTAASEPFVLALWSIHCEPCLREMAQWAPLQQRYPGVRIVLVATDPPRERKKVTEMLARFDLHNVETWAFADDFEERVRYSIDPRWRGELPRTYLYDSTQHAEARSGAELPWLEAWLASHARPK